MEQKKKIIKEAAALKYSPDSNAAPQIVALGKGEIAQKILERAKENDVPIYENAELAHVLNVLSIGDEIPDELYEVVAQILVFVSEIDKNHGKKYLAR